MTLFCTGIPAWAHEPVDGSIFATGAAFTYLTDTRGENPVFTAPALVAEADLSSSGGVEIVMAYLRNSFTVRRDSGELTESMKRMYISTGYRYWYNKYWSVAFGFASSYSMGDRKVIRDDFKANRPDSSASDVTEYGFDFSVQYEAWARERFAIVIDGRYALSVTAKDREDSNHMGVMVGIKYFVQARDKAPDMD